VLWLGLYPAPFLDILQTPLNTIIELGHAATGGAVHAPR